MCSRLPRGLAWVLLSGACLPELDRQRIEVLCQGGTPDGFLQGSEECDDGNREQGDGCDDACRLRCDPPSVLDPATGHCYQRIDGETDVISASNRCGRQGGALVTLRSQDELAKVSALLAGAPGPLLTAYKLYEGDVSATDFVSVHIRAAIPWSPNLRGEPGIPYATEPSAPCGGCFFEAGPEGDWWREGAALRLALVAGPGPGEGRLVVVDPAQPGAFAGAICERPRPGALPSPCPANCPERAYAQVRIGAADYVAFKATADEETARNRAAAQKHCESIGGHLWTLPDGLAGEQEREAVLRAMALTTQDSITELSLDEKVAGARFWVGLRFEEGSWRWDDAPGPSPALPWALTPNENLAAATGCAVVITLGDHHARGLLAPKRCEVDPKGQPAGFICEVPRP